MNRPNSHEAALLELTFESAPYAMIMTNEAGEILLVNKLADELLGFGREELLGRSMTSVIPKAMPATEEDCAQSTSLRAAGGGRQFFVRCKDGSELPAELACHPIATADGAFTLSTIVDATDRPRTRRELQDYAHELETRNQELEEFSYVASHDLQEPLRKLTTFAHHLIEDIGDTLSDRAQQDLDYIIDAAQRMHVLVQDLLALARSGKAEIHATRVSLDECVDQALAALGVSIQEKAAKISRESLPEVLGDQALLTQVFQNLISNALKFSADERRIEIGITAQARDHDWVIGVRDNGIGVPADQVHCLFIPFKRLHGGHKIPGSGIGLALCRKVVERHHGRIWVERNRDHGCHFFFTLPERSVAKDKLSPSVSTHRSSASTGRLESPSASVDDARIGRL